MPTADVDVLTILDALATHGVEYVVIGGFAVELHRVAVAPTRDIDLTPAQTHDNLTKLAAALRQLNARFRVVEGSEGSIAIPDGVSAELLASLGVVTLWTDAGALDIAMVPDGTSGYADLYGSSTIADYEGRPVPIASLADIIRSKEAAGREKDLRVLPALRAHMKRQPNK
jgi:hypothetical protein